MSRSLGSRETFGKEAAYGFEWALIAIDDYSSTRDDSLTNAAKTNSDEKLSVTSVASKSALAGTYLLLQAPRGTTIVIAISTESSVQLNSGNSHLRLWTVQVDRIEDGDCGSWVIDRVTGELFGMLVATCEALCEAYILPVKDIFTEIETVSGHFVRLPNSKPSSERKEPTNPSSPNLQPRKLEETKALSSSTEQSNFLYLPLRADSIRILTLLPGDLQAPVECELSIHVLDSSPDYEGLSYVWNRRKLTTSINIDGRSISVDSNLASALMDLRYADRHRSLWIDALCIKQEDNEEKNDQLSLLASIMTRASSVCLWLGQEDDLCHRVFSSYDSILNPDSSGNSVHHYIIEDAPDLFSGLLKEARFHLGIVQAICLTRNSTVHCGRYSMPWKAFVDIVAILNNYYDRRISEPNSSYRKQRRQEDEQDIPASLLSLSLLVDSISKSVRWLDDGQIRRELSLASLVIGFSWIEPTVYHDAIYSMLPLARDVSPSSKSSTTSGTNFSTDDSQSFNQLQYTLILDDVEAFHSNVVRRTPIVRPFEGQTMIVNYSQPFEHVCKDFVQFVIQNSQSLNILCDPWAPLSDALPSWVSQSSLASHLLDGDNHLQRVNGITFSGEWLGNRIFSMYDASRRESPVFHMSINSKGAPRISVKGFVLDALQAKESPALMGNIPPGWIDLLGWDNLNAPPPEKVWRTLVGDRAFKSASAPPISYPSACHRVFQRVGPKHGLNISQEIDRSDPYTETFLQHVTRVVWGRRLIKTKKNDFLGLAPGATKKRDIVAILYGLSVPVVLRQIQDGPEGEDVFKLVGECFIYGMMDGEAMDFREAQGIQDQTFVLE